ncbi:acyl-CoA dehydrogenase family protein [Rhodovibrionaceae bacterium A322]
MINLTYSPAQEAFREEARDWLSQNVPSAPLPSFDTAEGFAAHRRWEETLNDGGWAMVTWPRLYGGRGADLIEWLIFEEEYHRLDAPGRVNQNGLFLLGPTLMEQGTAEQKARFLPKMASGKEVWAQAWSEPGAGSDLASLRCSARRDGDHYVISGQKTWSTRAAFADWCFGLFRSDPDSEKHRGLTFLLLPLHSPGITLRPIPQLDGKPGFAEIFFDDVRVPVENRLGAEGDGWKIAMSTAGFERGLLLRSPARFQRSAEKLIALFQAHRDRVSPDLEARVIDCWRKAEAYNIATYKTACHLAAGGKIGAEASCNKIFWSELDRELHETALEILGPLAEVRSETLASDPLQHDWLGGYLFSLAGPIYAGTNEIQRNIVAERVLGLPRL